jgi:Phage integrase, N-terminal SAM-like domain
VLSTIYRPTAAGRGFVGNGPFLANTPASLLTPGAYRSDLAQLRQFLGGRELVTAGHRDIGDFVLKLFSDQAATASVIRKISACREFYKFLLLEGIIQTDPMVRVECPKKGRALPKVLLSVAEMATVLETLRPHCKSRKVVSGNPDPKHVSTSFVERQNLSMRMSIRRFTRLTNAFSKKVEKHAAAVALWFMYYNFCRIHQTLRVTPAMEAGISTHVWRIEELVSLISN